LSLFLSQKQNPALAGRGDGKSPLRRLPAQERENEKSLSSKDKKFVSYDMAPQIKSHQKGWFLFRRLCKP